MKKMFVLLALCCGTSMVAHAATQPAAPLGTQSSPNHVIQASQPEPVSVDAGSGDDIDTANEAADTDNDNDPEIEDSSPPKHTS